MSIDIRSTDLDRRLLEQQRTAKPAELKAPTPVAEQEDKGPKTRAGSDSIVISKEARALEALEGKAQTAPELDMAKIEQIRKEISEGRYHVDPQRLAQQIIDLERELLA